ncbi:MAG: right-handed parallel beta-helix repeat-containing protein [Dehalococcoidia bacterium]|nr:right-handed parallel beta-helix repeat-containing protein [Dehalococcoidia bacterium]
MTARLVSMLVALALCLSLVYVLVPPSARPVRAATTWYVNPGESIQDAVDSASPGDTIILGDGLFTDNVNVAKAVTIQSEHGAAATTVQAANRDDDVFCVTADGVNISGLTVRDATGWLFAGISLMNVSHCTISGNSLISNCAGIQLENSDSNTLIGNYLSANWYYGIRIAGSDGNTVSGNTFSDTGYYGLDLGSESSENVIAGNVFTHSGLYVSARHNTVEDNTVNGKPLVYLEGVSGATVTGPDVGQVILVDCDRITVDGLTLDSTTVGIELWNTVNSTVKNNIINWSTYAINLHESTCNLLTKNTLGSYFGIYLALAESNVITENDVLDSAYAMESWLSVNNTIYLNNFRFTYGCSTEENLLNFPRQLTYEYDGSTRVGYMGNYWGNYYGNDVDGDGIGDTPYSMGGSQQDNYPLMQPFENYSISPVEHPIIRSVLPSQGAQGQTLTVVISGQYLDGAANVDFGPGITVNSLTFNSMQLNGLDQITINITIDTSAALELRDVSVTTPYGTGTKAGGFAVVEAASKRPSRGKHVGKLGMSTGHNADLIAIVATAA